MALKRSRIKRIQTGLFFTLMWLIFILMVVFLGLVLIGFCSYGDLAYFKGIFKDGEFRFALSFTLWTSMLATILAALVALPSGYILSRFSFPGRIFLDTLLDVPIVLPPLVSGIALMIFFGPFLDKLWPGLNINVVFTPLGVIVAQWFIAVPFAIKSCKQAFGAIDVRMEKVAQTLGFSPPGVFFRVTLPLAKNGLIGGLMMAWSRALGEFGATAMLAGITRMKTETLSVAVFLNMSIGEMNFAISTALVMLFMAITILIGVKVILGKGAGV